MLDVTGGELLVLVGAAAIFLGKKEVPQLARMAGRATGKMVALLNTAREQFTKATQDTQLSKLHEEVRQNMYELHSIRSELRSAGLATTRPAAAAAAAAGGALLRPPFSSSSSSSMTTPALASARLQQPGVPAPAVGPAAPEATGAAAASREAGGRGMGSTRLGGLAMAEILLQKSAAQGGAGARATAAGSQAAQQQAQGAAAAGPPSSGSDVVEDVLLETLIRDHVDRFSKGSGGGQQQ